LSIDQLIDSDLLAVSFPDATLHPLGGRAADSQVPHVNTIVVRDLQENAPPAKRDAQVIHLDLHLHGQLRS
jgi:hypothetical protein